MSPIEGGWVVLLARILVLPALVAVVPSGCRCVEPLEIGEVYSTVNAITTVLSAVRQASYSYFVRVQGEMLEQTVTAGKGNVFVIVEAEIVNVGNDTYNVQYGCFGMVDGNGYAYPSKPIDFTGWRQMCLGSSSGVLSYCIGSHRTRWWLEGYQSMRPPALVPGFLPRSWSGITGQALPRLIRSYCLEKPYPQHRIPMSYLFNIRNSDWRALNPRYDCEFQTGPRAL